MLSVYLIITVTCAYLCESVYIVSPGPKYPPTKGEVWPKPQQYVKLEKYYTFNPSHFNFSVTSHSCRILTDALNRYVYLLQSDYSIIRRNRKRANGKRKRKRLCTPFSSTQDENYEGTLNVVKVTLTKPCEDYPHLNMEESYNLTISTSSSLISTSIWGILNGLETFSQLFYLSDNLNEMRINQTQIGDYPRYSHRGLLLDTGRHYVSLRNILLTLDAMAYNKMNVFHWHVVDDQSFPYQSEKLPQLSARGAYSSSAIYTKEDVRTVINHARDRGIRVIPEFDVPGHTASWGVAFPNILTKCYVGNNAIGLGPMNPINNATYKLIKDLFEEVNDLFPDKYFHIGGDEVDLSCWLSNPELQEYMREHNFETGTDFHALFMQRVSELIDRSKQNIVWQEVFDENVPLSNDTLIHIWKRNPIPTMFKVLNSSHSVIFSSSWYLDQKQNLGTWQELYECDPREMINNATLEKRIVGGEACMWGELVDNTNVISRVWPRTCAVAERLWSNNVGTPIEALHRIEEQTCRLIRRGIDAQPPNGPSYCAV